MTYEYRLSDDARHEVFIHTGVLPPRDQRCPLDPLALSQEARRALLPLTSGPGVFADTNIPLGRYDLPEFGSAPRLIRAEFAAPLLLTDLCAEIIATAASYTAALPLALQRDKEQQAARRQRDEEQARRDHASRERDRLANEKADQERATQQAAKKGWIADHASPRLQRAFAAGYDCQRLYVTERARVDFPGASVDFDDNACWKERSCPSEAALDLQDALAALPDGPAQVVWLTVPPVTNAELAAHYDSPDSEPDEWAPQEAVIVRGYLGKYNLIRTL